MIKETLKKINEIKKLSRAFHEVNDQAKSTKTDNYIKLCEESGYKDIRIEGFSRSQLNKLDYICGTSHQSSIKFSYLSTKVINYEDYIQTVNSMLDMDYDELYINAIRCLLHNWSRIGIVDHNLMTSKIYKELITAGKQVELINDFSFSDNKLLLEEQVNGQYDAILICDPFDQIREAYNVIDFHENLLINFLDFFRIASKKISSFERDIALHIYPKAKNEGIAIYLIENPETYQITSDIHIDPISSQYIPELKDRLTEFLGKADINDIEESSKLVVKDGYIDFCDYDGNEYTQINGERPISIPSRCDSLNIYTYGNCMMRGNYCCDNDTIGYHLQKNTSDYRIHIKTTPEYWVGMVLHRLKVKNGDIILLLMNNTEYFREKGIPVISIQDCYYDEQNRIKSNVMWDTPLHVNSKISKEIAKEIFDSIKNNSPVLSTKSVYGDTHLFENRNKYNYVQLYLDHNDRLNNYIKECSNSIDRKENCGAIVMNCNPFTLGHLYLIEKASLCVEKLYVFVVQENNSFFSYRDRMNMVQIGTSKLRNVQVFPSGEFMISMDTMPGYFIKEKLQDKVLDASYDLRLFCEVIAPVFGIITRFAGEEPEDKYTNQYNEQMKEVLPQYGINFVMIKRKQKDGKVISASRVRQLYLDQLWDEMIGLVPSDVIDYLKRIRNK